MRKPILSVKAHNNNNDKLLNVVLKKKLVFRKRKIGKTTGFEKSQHDYCLEPNCQIFVQLVRLQIVSESKDLKTLQLFINCYKHQI